MGPRIHSSVVAAMTVLAACIPDIKEASEIGLAEDGSDSGTGTGDGDGDGDTDPGDGDGDGGPASFRVVVLADPHVIGPSYMGDDQTLLAAKQRLLETREKIAAITPAPDFAIVLGDLVHEAYDGPDVLWYQTNPNAFADIVEIFEGFPIPVYPLFGDSDYDVPDSTKQLSHTLFGQFFARDPYYVVDHLGWRFVFANSQYGQTFDTDTLLFDPTLGSFGGAQLKWISEQLIAGKPTVLLSHFPLFTVAADEAPNNGDYPDLDAVLELDGDSLALALSGHDHKWANLPANFVAPHVVFGSTRFDSDNFLLIEFATNSNQYTILDAAKAGWGTAEADTWVYDGVPVPAN